MRIDRDADAYVRQALAALWPQAGRMNTATISGVVLKQYGDILPSGRPFVRLTIRNDSGVFVAVGYGDVAEEMARAGAGARVVVHGSLRQRKPNHKTLWEIIVADIVIVEGIWNFEK